MQFRYHPRLGVYPGYVNSMWLTFQQEEPSDHVVSTGIAATIRDFCEASFSDLNMDYKEFVETEDRHTRPTEADPLIGDLSNTGRILG
jgi:GDPmannose 4,6-dehydratase